MQLNDSSRPADFFFGEVIEEEPIRIKINDKLILNENQLVRSRCVTDYLREETSEPEFPDDITNSEDYKRRKKIFVYNRLKKSETVILARTFGGQTYFVLDRVS